MATDVAITVATGGAGKVAGKVFTKAVGWGGNAFERGRKVEQVILKKVGAKPMKSSNYPVIDSISKGIARSIKSIDTNAKTYQNTKTLKNTLKRYIDKLDKYNGKKWGGDDIDSSIIKGKALDIGVPKGMSAEQAQVFKEMANYAKQRNIKFKVHTLK